MGRDFLRFAFEIEADEDGLDLDLLPLLCPFLNADDEEQCSATRVSGSDIPEPPEPEICGICVLCTVGIAVSPVSRHSECSEP